MDGWQEARLEPKGPPLSLDSADPIAPLEPRDREQMAEDRSLGMAGGKIRIEALSLAEQPRVEQQPAELVEVVGAERVGPLGHIPQLKPQQAMHHREILLAHARQNQLGNAAASFRILVVEPQHHLVLPQGLGRVIAPLGKLAKREKGVEMIGHEFEHAAVLLAGFVESAHLREQFTEVEQRLRVARIGAQFLEIELPRPLVPPGTGVRSRKRGLQPRHVRIEPGSLPQAPHRAVVQLAVQQALSHGCVEVRVVGVDLLAEVERGLSVFVASKCSQRPDAMGKGDGRLRIAHKGLIQQGDRPLGLLPAKGVDARHQVALGVLGIEEAGLLKRVGGVAPAAGRGQRQSQIEVPFRLIGIKSDRRAEFALRLVPSARVVVLVGLLDMTLGFEPIVHRASAEQESGPPGNRCYRHAEDRSMSHASTTTARATGFASARMLCAALVAACALLLGASPSPADDRDPASSPQRVSQTLELLATQHIGTEEQRRTIESLAAWPDVPRSMFDRLVAIESSSPEADRPAVLRAMAGVRTRECVAYLLARAGPESPARVRAAAFEALAGLTGRDDFGDDLTAWQSWALQGLTLSETQWRRRIIAGLAARGARLTSDRSVLAGRLIDAHRDLWLAQPPERQDEFLAKLLQDRLPELRRLGAELARLELSGGEPLGEAVVVAAIALLDDPHPRWRREGAALLDLIAPARGGEAIVAALAEEAVPEAAAGLLRASVRWPDARNLEPALRWLEHGGEATAASTQALLALHDQQLIAGDGAPARIISALRDRSIEEIGGSGMRLLVALGSDEDRRRVALAMTSESSTLRRAAAEALILRADALDALLDAASLDPALFGPAMRAATQHRPDAASFASLSEAIAKHESLRWEAIVPFAQRMPQAELRIVAWGAKDQAERERLFELLLPGGEGELAADAADQTIADFVELARIRLDASRAGEALAALQRIPPARLPSEGRWVKLVALVSLGRLDEAEAVEGTPAAWIEGLTRAVEQPYARAILTRIVERFEARLDEPARARLAEIELTLKPQPTPEGDG